MGLVLRDLSYPLSAESSTFDELSKDQDVVANAARLLLETAVGEVEGDPPYGTTLWSFVFDHQLMEHKARLHAAIASPLRRYVPQVEVAQIRVDAEGDQEDTYVIDFVFKTAGKPGLFEIGITQ